MKADHAELNQFIESMELVKTHSLNDYFIDRQKKSLWDFIHTSMRTDSVVTGISALGSNYYQFVYVVIAALLGMSLAGNDAGMLAFFLFATQKVISFSDNLEAGIWQIMRMAPAFDNVERLLSLGEEGTAGAVMEGEERDSVEIREIWEIEFRNVIFFYQNGNQKKDLEEDDPEKKRDDTGRIKEKQDSRNDENQLIKSGDICNGQDANRLLNDYSEIFRCGDIVQIIGANGSGKSTLVKLMTGLLKPAEGEILINGIPISRIRRSSLNHCILYISQDEILLNDSPKHYLEQITGLKLSDETYQNLLADVGLPPDLPEIKAGGMNLSGGQRKKLMLLNLKLRWKEASVILLDEVENALDQETREYATALLNEICEDRERHIVFRISHTGGINEFMNREIKLEPMRSLRFSDPT